MPAKPNARKRHKTRHPGVYYRVARDGQRAYEITYRDEHADQCWKRIHGNQDAAVAALAEIKARKKAGDTVRPDNRTLRALFDEWGESGYGTNKTRPSTLKGYTASMRRYVLPQLGDVPVQKITRGAVVRWLSDLKRSGGKDGRPLAGWTARGALTPLRNLLDRAVDEGLIPRNPVRALEKHNMPVLDEKQKRILTPDESRRLIGAASDRFKLPIKLLATTGVRASELCGLVWGDLDLSAGTMAVTRQLGDDAERTELKSDAATRTIQLPDRVVKELATRRLAAFHSGERDWVFAREDGSPMAYPSLESGFKEAAKRAGLRDEAEKSNATPHCLRHTFASMLIALGHDVVTISHVLGHADSSITLRIYARQFETRDDAERKRALAVGVGKELAAALNA